MISQQWQVSRKMRAGGTIILIRGLAEQW